MTDQSHCRMIRSLQQRLETLETMLSRDQCSELRPCRNGGTCVNTYSGYFCTCPGEIRSGSSHHLMITILQTPGLESHVRRMLTSAPGSTVFLTWDVRTEPPASTSLAPTPAPVLLDTMVSTAETGATAAPVARVRSCVVMVSVSTPLAPAQPTHVSVMRAGPLLATLLHAARSLFSLIQYCLDHIF